MIRTGQISSTELLDHYLARIKELDERTNAVVTLAAERALKEAKRADRAQAAGDLLGPLHGLPVSVKDTIETAGVRTTAGDPNMVDHLPEQDAFAVARLRKAGAIVFAKTNAPLYGGDAQTYNEVFGVTNNPWDLKRSPGGSSGGSAVALAAGFTGLDIGSDIGGSVRNPAHYCGIFGHKPSFGLIPTTGHLPPAPGSLRPVDMAVIGPMARSAPDLDLALEVMAGWGVLEDRRGPVALSTPRRTNLGDYRVAAWLDDQACPVSVDVRALLEAVLEKLEDEKVRVNRDLRPGTSLESMHELYRRLNYGVTAAGLPDELFSKLLARVEVLDDTDIPHRVAYAQHGTQRLRDWINTDDERQRLRMEWQRFFEGVDVLLTPVVSTVAIQHDHTNINSRTIVVNGEPRDYWDQTVWTGMASAFYLPATVIPIGVNDDGLPVGIQIMGPYLEDRTTIDFASKLSELIGGFESPPKL